MPPTAHHLRAEIDRVVFDLMECGLVIDKNDAKLLHAAGATTVTWNTAQGRPFDLKGDLGLVPDYVHCLKSRQFSCVFDDGGFLQITYGYRGNEMIMHRLCYVPCPVRLGPDDFDPSLSLLTVLSPHFEKEIAVSDRLRMRAPIRFDYSADAPSNEPVSHLTLLHNQCRIPVFGPMRIGEFVRFVVRNFYPQTWKDCRAVRDLARNTDKRTIRPDEEGELFVECRGSVRARDAGRSSRRH